MSIINVNTPLQELINWINSDCTPMDCVLKAKELLERERKTIIDAYSNGFVEGKWQTDGNDNIYHAKKYFNKKFK
jgi:hypothetical protein